MKIAILDAKTLGEDCDLSIFEKFGDLEIYETTTKFEAKTRCKDIDIAVTNKVVFDKEILDLSKNLKLIALSATGMNNVDLVYAKEKGVEVKNVAGYSTKSVTQHTFAMALYLIEQLKYYDDYAKNGLWSSSPIFTHLERSFFEIDGKKWGIIGLGEIGKEVAKVATAFGAEILYYSTSRKNSNSAYKMVELSELLSTCDIISIHAPLNENTQNLLNKENLTLLKDRAILLNLGRGGIINEQDLASALDSKNIYVGLDVTNIEPIEQYNPLNFIKDKNRLLITPHIAWGSIEARRRLIKEVAQNIEESIKLWDMQ